MMKNSAVLILSFCIVETFATIAYKAKFYGHMKVTGDSETVLALSVTHCLAKCNKNAECDAINFNDQYNKCRMFKRCMPVNIQPASEHYFYYAKRPPILDEGYVYEARSDSCLKLTTMEHVYRGAVRDCELDGSYLSALNTPELIAVASELLSFQNSQEAWAAPLSEADRNSPPIGRLWKDKRKREKRESSTCRVLRLDKVEETTLCERQQRFGVCQIPLY